MLQLWPWRVVVHVLGSYSFVPTNIGYELMTYEPLPRSSAVWVLGFERVGAIQSRLTPRKTKLTQPGARMADERGTRKPAYQILKKNFFFYSLVVQGDGKRVEDETVRDY